MRYVRVLLTAAWLSGVSLTAEAAWFGYSGYWECILEEMQGVGDDANARRVMRSCKQRYPDISRVTPRSPWFGVKTRQQCRVAYGGRGAGARAEKLVRVACNRLYVN